MLRSAQYDPCGGEQRYIEGRLTLVDGSAASASRHLSLGRGLLEQPAYWGTTCRPWAAVGHVIAAIQHDGHVTVRLRLGTRPLAQALWTLLGRSHGQLLSHVVAQGGAQALSPAMIVLPEFRVNDAFGVESSDEGIPSRRSGRGRLPPPPASLPLLAL